MAAPLRASPKGGRVTSAPYGAKTKHTHLAVLVRCTASAAGLEILVAHSLRARN
jgi:hypothetical protein